MVAGSPAQTPAPSARRGFLNLLASLEQGLGRGEVLNPAPPLPDLMPETIASHRHVMVWLIDGFALDYLVFTTAMRGDLAATLQSTFPSTTASAVTSMLTGLSPAQHGLLGWYTYLPVRDRILTVLLARETDAAGRQRVLDGPSLADRLRPRPLVNRLARAATLISPSAIAHSTYNRLMSGNARILGYERLEQLPALLSAHVRAVSGTPHYTYLYWAQLDHLGHDHGPDSPEVRDHLSEIDAVYRALCRELEGTDVLLLTTTDHGMRPVSRRLDLREAPAVRGCLRHPLTGEPRAALAHVRPGRHRHFRDAVQDAFGGRMELIPIDDCLSGFAFGAGMPHPELRARAGDYLLLPDDDSYLVDPPGREPAPCFRGAHGGATARELEIPLLARGFGVATASRASGIRQGDRQSR
jgi:hypothetical protein